MFVSSFLKCAFALVLAECEPTLGEALARWCNSSTVLDVLRHQFLRRCRLCRSGICGWRFQSPKRTACPVGARGIRTETTGLVRPAANDGFGFTRTCVIAWTGAACSTSACQV